MICKLYVSCIWFQGKTCGGSMGYFKNEEILKEAEAIIRETEQILLEATEIMMESERLILECF